MSVTPRDALVAHTMVTALRLRMNERLLWDIWDIPEIFDTKDGGAANFKKIKQF